MALMLFLGCGLFNEKDEQENYDQYLKNGELTTLSQENKDLLGLSKVNYKGMKALVWGYMLKESAIYKNESDGGESIGKRNANQIINDKNSTGTHDYATILASIYRELGLPVVMIETVNLEWAKKFQEKKIDEYLVHVLLEVYINSEWVLVDPIDGYFSLNYDVNNPYFKIGDNGKYYNYYKLHKGLDTLDYGINSQDELNKSLEEFAKNFVSNELTLETCIMHSVREHYEDIINDFDKVFTKKVIVNYKYTGNYDISEETFINLGLGRFTFGFSLESQDVFSKEGLVEFDLKSDFPFFYLGGYIDIDQDDRPSTGDVEFVYKDGSKMPISIYSDQSTFDLEFDDSLRNN